MPSINLDTYHINTEFVTLLKKKLGTKPGLTHNIFISPLFGSSKALLVSQISKKTNQILILLPDSKSVKEFNVELNILGVTKNIISLNEFSSDVVQEKLSNIIKNDTFIILSTYDILRLELPLKEIIKSSTTQIEIGADLAFDDLIEYLNLLNFQKDKFVEAQGSYAQRGSIVDFWSYSERNPVRLEFDGDFLESIRYFDPDNQRSIDVVKAVTLAGSFTENKKDMLENNTASIFDYLKTPLVLASEYNLENIPSDKINLFDGTESDPLKSDVENEIFDADEITTEKTDENANPETEIFNVNGFADSQWIIEQELKSSKDIIDLGITEPFTINGNYNILSQSLIKYASSSYTILITSENELQTQRLKDLLSELDSKIADLIEAGKIKFISLAIKEGFIIRDDKLLRILPILSILLICLNLFKKSNC